MNPELKDNIERSQQLALEQGLDNFSQGLEQILNLHYSIGIGKMLILFACSFNIYQTVLALLCYLN